MSKQYLLTFLFAPIGLLVVTLVKCIRENLLSTELCISGVILRVYEFRI